VRTRTFTDEDGIEPGSPADGCVRVGTPTTSEEMRGMRLVETVGLVLIASLAAATDFALAQSSGGSSSSSSSSLGAGTGGISSAPAARSGGTATNPGGPTAPSVSPGTPNGSRTELARPGGRPPDVDSGRPAAVPGVPADQVTPSDGGARLTHRNPAPIPNNDPGTAGPLNLEPNLATGAGSAREGAGGNTMGDCMAAWDSETHVSRENWRRICARTLTKPHL
jgi:hypothetical protein